MDLYMYALVLIYELITMRETRVEQYDRLWQTYLKVTEEAELPDATLNCMPKNSNVVLQFNDLYEYFILSVTK